MDMLVCNGCVFFKSLRDVGYNWSSDMKALVFCVFCFTSSPGRK